MKQEPGQGFNLRARIRSFVYAFKGLYAAWADQHNLWIHSLVAAAVTVAGFWLQLPRKDWAILVLTISMVIAAELFNSAIESAVDLASPDLHPLAGRAKDIAAAAVLVTAIGAIVVGLLILGPPLLEKLAL